MSDDEVISESKKLGFDVIPLSLNDDSFFIGESDDMNVIVFRGIDRINDAKDCVSLKNRKLTTDNIPVHSGFYKRFSDIWNFIFPYMNNFYKNDKKIVICGHSLGGALASLFSMHMYDFFKREIKVVTFAAPKIGKGKWKRFMNDKITNGEISLFNVVNKEDLIPKIPLWIFGWRRPGSTFYLGNFSFLKILKEIPIAHKITRYKRLLYLELNKK